MAKPNEGGAGKKDDYIDDGPVYKSYTVKKFEVDDDEEAFVATITTAAIDRDNEIMLPKGGDFTEFLKNPVVPFGHDYRSLPVAKALWVKEARGKLIMKAVPAPTDMGKDVYALIKGGFLNAVSIGYDPDMEMMGPPNEKELRKHPDWAGVRNVIRKWALTEVSVVPVPANPEALINAVGKGMKLSAETRKFFKSIDVDVRPRPVQVAVNRIPAKVKLGRKRAAVTVAPKISPEQAARILEDRIALKLGRVL